MRGRGRALAYRLHVPPKLDPRGAPLVVALHGCTQNAADFARGTRFDELGDRYGAVVVYPQQSLRHNLQRCWRWYSSKHQQRDGGEPAMIVAVVREVCARHAIDPARIFVAGLSSGAAMAAILGEQLPDVFAAVGLMAGVALHASHDVSSGMRAMKGHVHDHGTTLPAVLAGVPRGAYERLRVMIWAGDRDDVVAPANALVLARQFGRILGLPPDPVALDVPDGTVREWRDATGAVRVELRSVGGLGHAWSGGSARGSYTAPNLPRVSDAMFAFFLAPGGDAAGAPAARGTAGG